VTAGRRDNLKKKNWVGGKKLAGEAAEERQRRDETRVRKGLASNALHLKNCVALH